jgi:hypothetical protein
MQRREWAENFLPGIVQTGVWKLTLASQNLPKTQIRLQHSQGVRSGEAIRNLIQALGDGEKL